MNAPADTNAAASYVAAGSGGRPAAPDRGRVLGVLVFATTAVYTLDLAELAVLLTG